MWTINTFYHKLAHIQQLFAGMHGSWRKAFIMNNTTTSVKLIYIHVHHQHILPQDCPHQLSAGMHSSWKKALDPRERKQQKHEKKYAMTMFSHSLTCKVSRNLYKSSGVNTSVGTSHKANRLLLPVPESGRYLYPRLSRRYLYPTVH
jgi:DNA-binding helix-hairpin-helix protein with protein kinase domain